MRKTLKTILVLSMVLAVCFTNAFAANVSSKTNVVDVTKAVDQNGNAATITATASDVTLTAQEASDIILAEGAEIVNAQADNLTVVSVQDLHSDVLPVTITFNIGANVPLYVFHHDGSKWNLVGKGANGVATVTFTDLSPVALVAERSSATPGSGDKGNSGNSGNSGKSGSAKAGNTGKSYKTGENSIVLAGCTVALAAGAVVIASRKKKA